MLSPLAEISCACLPKDALALLARLRIEPGVQAALTDRHTWIRWDAGNDDVLRTVLPIHGAELFRFHEGRWHRFGRTLPAFDFPADLDYQPLAHVLFPAPALPIAARPPDPAPVRLSLKRDDHPRQTSALLCDLSSLSAWSDTVPTSRLTSLQAVRLGEQALVLGNDVPMPARERFWGSDVLIPLGYVVDPALPESALKQIAGVTADQLLLWRPSHVEAIARELLAPLTRAGLRLAAREERA